MTADMFDALFSILVVTIACLVLSPLLVWILPRREGVGTRG